MHGICMTKKKHGMQYNCEPLQNQSLATCNSLAHAKENMPKLLGAHALDKSAHLDTKFRLAPEPNRNAEPKNKMQLCSQ